MSFRNYVRNLLIFVTILQQGSTTPTWHVARDGKAYLIEPDNKYNWLEANDLCARQNLQLVTIDSYEKNAAFDSLLRTIFAQSTNLWLGHHDEFNREKNTERPFYSVSSGNEVVFNNWQPGEPNNLQNIEHCAHIYSAYDFKWNDKSCEAKYGYVCEKHHLTDKYSKDLEHKRQDAYAKNIHILSEFDNTQNEIKVIIDDTQRETENILSEMKQSTDKVFANSNSSLNEIVKKKPYLEAVITDVGEVIREILMETQKEIEKVYDEARHSIEDVHLNTVNATSDACGRFANKLSENTNAVDKLLV